MAREHVLNVVFDASQVEEGIDVVQLGPDLPLLALPRMPELVLEMLPAACGDRDVVICPPQGIHLLAHEKPPL